MKEYKFDDFLHEIAKERGKHYAEELITFVKANKLESPIEICHGAIPWLKDIDTEWWYSIEDLLQYIDDEDRKFQISVTKEESWWEGFESIIEDQGYFIHGNEGDGSTGYICDGTCEWCKEQED